MNYFDLDCLMPSERKEPAEEQMAAWNEHYAGVLRKYGFDDRNTEMFGSVASYLSLRHAIGKGFSSSKRGLFLVGGVGTGKTHAIRILSGLFKVPMVSASELARQYAIGGDEGFFEYTQDMRYKEIIIDDIGSERELKHFGNAGIIGEYLNQRYDTWTLDHRQTHITSNLSKADFMARYGERTWSRLCEMCLIVPVIGEDRRRVA